MAVDDHTRTTNQYASPAETPGDDWDYQTALRAIWARSGYDRGYVSNPFAGDEAARLGLRRVEALLEALGRPQERYGVVHVAGSKGKGSTCAFLVAILRSTASRSPRSASAASRNERSPRRRRWSASARSWTR
jgi:hypothetical protein